MQTATITDTRNFYAGRKVRILTSSDWGGVVVHKVELVDHPGLTMHACAEHLRVDQ